MNNITILLTIYNRPHYTEKWLNYYIANNCPYKLFICDGGNNEELTKKILKLTNKFKNIKYKKFQFYDKFEKFHEKFFQAANNIDTKYTFICEDDDFIIFSNLKKLQKFLDANKDYSCVGGINIELEEVKSHLLWRYYILNTDYNADISYEDSTPDERCIEAAKKINSNYNCLHKTENLKIIFKFLYELNSYNLWITELIFIIMSAYFGKIKRVNYITYIKMANIEVSSSYAYFKYINFFYLISSKNFANDNYAVQDFLDNIISKENQGKLEKEINIHLSNFYNQITVEYFKEHKLINKFKKNIPLKKILKFFFLFIKNLKYYKKFNIICKTNLSYNLLLSNFDDLTEVMNFLRKNKK